MKIRMTQERTGPRHDGQAWPPVGGVLDVEDEEGAAIVEHGWAEAAEDAAEATAGTAAAGAAAAAPKRAQRGAKGQ